VDRGPIVCPRASISRRKGAGFTKLMNDGELTLVTIAPPESYAPPVSAQQTLKPNDKRNAENHRQLADRPTISARTA
jgi:hypothetical protein